MRNTLRQMADSGVLNAAGFPPAKKPPVAGKPPIAAKPPMNGKPQVGAKPPISEGANPETAKIPTGATAPQGLAPELHIHVHPDAGDDDMDQQLAGPTDDPSQMDPNADPEEMDPSDVDQDGTEGSPMAQQIAKTHVDPLGATKKTFGNLTKASLAYKQAQEEAKRSVIPALAVLKHVSDAHQLQPAMPGMGMDPNNPDAQMGYDPNTGQPTNMNQQPGMMQNMQQPGAGMNPVGTGPLVPGGAPGSAATGSQKSVVPPKKGVPKPGQSNPATKAGKPGEDTTGGKKVKLEINGGAEVSAYRRRRPSRIEAAATLHNLRF